MMKILASETSNYKFELQANEFKNSTGIYKNLTVVEGKSTYPLYKTIPYYAIQNGIYNDVTHLKTRMFNNSTEFLSSIGMAVHIELQQVVMIDSLVLESWKTISIDNNDNFVLNHIPQLFCKTEFGYITYIDGDYDVVSRRFTGQLRLKNEINPS
jgi:hypothetical protein